MFGRRREREDDLERELRAHVETEAEEQRIAGAPRGEAHYAAQRSFGNTTLVKEAVREMWGWTSLERFVQDLRYAARVLRQSPGFTAIAVLILGLGIGANTAIYSIIDAVLLRPLPFFEPDRLVIVWEEASRIGFPRATPAPANYSDWKEQNQVFREMAAIGGRTMNITGSGDPQRINVDMVTAGLFPMLGVKPAAGRLFSPQDDSPGAPKVAVVSHGLWQNRFGGDPNLIGRTIRLNDEQYVVIGIFPPGFEFLRKDTHVWIPIAFTPQELANRGAHYLTVVARLKPGVTVRQAQSDMDAVARRIEEKDPINAYRLRVLVLPLRDQLVDAVRPTLIALAIAVACVLLMTCANVANLLLSRAAGRGQEMSLRAALGAGRIRLVRQLLTESLVLALSGGVLGLVLARATFNVLTRLVPSGMSDWIRLELDSSVLLAALLISLTTAVAFGLVPALRLSRLDLNDALKQGARSIAGERRLRGILIVTEMALALVLAIGAHLMIQSFLRVKAVDIGFRPENVLTVKTALPMRYQDLTRRAAFYRDVLERVSRLPGVVAAGYTTALPLTFKGGTRGFSIEGRPPAPGRDAIYRQVSKDYLRAMGIPLRQGRGIEERDGPQSPYVAVISETMAAKFWPHEDPIGKRFKFGAPDAKNPWIAIIGVAGDVKQMGIEVPSKAEMYLSCAQAPNTGWGFGYAPADLAVRVAGDPMNLASAVRREIQAIDREAPIGNFRTMEDILGIETLQRRMQTGLLGTFAALALLLAALGIYGVISYTVTQRTREIGIRMALGASRGDVLRMIVRQGMLHALAGVAIGLALAFATTRLLATLLYGTRTDDPLAFVAGSLLLAAVALLACVAPARRAARIDPQTALRYE